MTPRDGILILEGESGLVVDANPFLTQLLGYPQEELVGKPFAEIGFLPERADAERLVEKIRREGYLRCDDVPLRGRTGVLVRVDLVGNSYFVDERTVIQLNIGDVSDRPPGRTETATGDVSVDTMPCGTLCWKPRGDLKTVLRTITSQARSLLKADVGELCLLRPERNLLGRCVAVGSAGSRLCSELRRGDGLAGRVWESEEKVQLQNDSLDLPRPEAGIGVSWKHALGVPISWSSEFLGVLGVFSGRDESFTDPEAQLLDLLAGQAAMAIINSRLALELEQLAVIDELTGVLNRRGLLTIGTREVERARRLDRPLAMLFVDLDHFKALNDSYSHRVGDKALREVSRAIHGNMRKIDVVARYGGEEFVVLLVETELGPAVEVGERVRQAVEARSLVTDRGMAQVTVSVGVTARGPKESDLEALIHRADEAMYAAKQAGRNRVVALAS